MGIQELVLVILALGVLGLVIAGGVFLGMRLSSGRRHNGKAPRPGGG